MKNRITVIFLFLFGVAAFLPLIQQVFKPIKLAGLQGVFDTGAMPELNVDSYVDGTFQSGTDYYLKYNTAFNGELVRLRNQIDYSLFGNINTILTLGKENYIFDPSYIAAREGTDLLSDSLFSDKAKHISRTIRFLKSQNVPLVVVFAPNKANYFSAFLPGISKLPATTNKKYFTNVLYEKGAEVFDCDTWFLQMKDTASYPLIPKYGAHWSTYGAAFAADSLCNRLGNILDKKTSGIHISGITLSDKARFTDDDYLPSLNLMEKWQSPVLAYPQLHFTDGYKPNALIISDSFIWNFYDLEVMQNCLHENSELWYYLKTGFDIYKNKTGSLSSDIVLKDVSERDVVIIICAESALTDFGFGFFEQVSNSVSNE